MTGAHSLTITRSMFCTSRSRTTSTRSCTLPPPNPVEISSARSRSASILPPLSASSLPSIRPDPLSASQARCLSSQALYEPSITQLPAHSSDIDRGKVINWKRRAETCGEIGVMGDLGMHVAHVPLRLGYLPSSVYALLDDIVTTRPTADGGIIPCDTWDNALLANRVPASASSRGFTMLWETRRIAPGNMNSWSFEALGMDGGVRFSTRTPTTLDRFTKREGEQVWEQVQPGNISAWPMISGGIFEFGFADALLQMWASFLAERDGDLGSRFGTATPQEALDSHRVFAAALRSQVSGCAEPLT